jgi:hypothetical protein
LISDDEINSVVCFLEQNADAAAKARAERIYAVEYRKSLKSLLMQEHGQGSIAQQERDAYADNVYIKHLIAIKEAVFNDEKAQFLREAAQAKLSAWQTQSANERGVR